MEIYLIRHTSVDVPAGYAYGQTDVPLKPTFEEEAEEVKKGLSDHTFDKVWTSPLTRCVRLANYCGFPEAGKRRISVSPADKANRWEVYTSFKTAI